MSVPPNAFPVEITQIIAWGVFAVLGEFDGKPMERTAVRTRHVSFDDQGGAELQPLQFRQHLRIEEFWFVGIIHNNIQHVDTEDTEISVFIMASKDIQSANTKQKYNC